MAEEKKKRRIRKKATKTDEPKKKTSMRDSAAQARDKAGKTKRVRRAAKAATKPVGKATSALNEEYHIFKQHDGGGLMGFLTKSRKITPAYVRGAAEEIKQVTWPGRKETWRLVFAVFVFAILLGLFIAGLDFVLEKLLREVIL